MGSLYRIVSGTICSIFLFSGVSSCCLVGSSCCFLVQEQAFLLQSETSPPNTFTPTTKIQSIKSLDKNMSRMSSLISRLKFPHLRPPKKTWIFQVLTHSQKTPNPYDFGCYSHLHLTSTTQFFCSDPVLQSFGTWAFIYLKKEKVTRVVINKTARDENPS